ncbi:MAG: glycosyltransferase family 39 protein [Anaerolineae bacterium]|nr:glycosyltransferase family 39 protein [Anaerolineae bacterium]
MQRRTIALLLLILTGFALRVYYLVSTHPFFDEYTTVLAARQVLELGRPILPSGLFYEHGLLSTYLIAPFTALYIHQPLADWQPGHWGLMLSRWPSVLISTLTISLIYRVSCKAIAGKSQAASNAALLAAGLFAVSPEGMVWGGRARMYALATLLVVLTVYFAYRGTYSSAPAWFRWLALVTMLAALLTQLGVLMLIPPLVVAMVINGYVTTRTAGLGTRPWFRQRSILWEGGALAVIVALAVFVKRLGQPIGFAPLDGQASRSLLTELFNTISYQTTFYFTWDETVQFFARQFGVPHHLWLTLVTIIGAGLGLVLLAAGRRDSQAAPPNSTSISNPKSSAPNTHSSFSILHSPFFTAFNLFLWLTFGLVILEMIIFLEPFRRNPRYLVMYLPLFYLIAAYAIFNFVVLLQKAAFPILRTTHYALGTAYQLSATIIILGLFTLLNLSDLRLALVTPEPAYEDAFAQVYADWQPGDILLTMNTPAAGLYLGQADGFTIQNDAEQFLLNTGTEPVDRWLGAPWIHSAAEFNALLNANPRTWFVTDTIRQPVYFRGDWQAILNTQMNPIWAGDNALVYRTRSDRTPLPTSPDKLVNVDLDHSIELVGFSLNPLQAETDGSKLAITLFWQTLAPLAADYTTFLHLRTSNGVTVAQRDSQPLDGTYPTSQWQPHETIIDPLTLALPEDLPAGSYQLYTGLYRLDTLARLPVTNDTSGENAVLLGEITLP